MKHRHFISEVDAAALAAAIADAESKTSGEIRVFVTRHACPDPLIAAQKQFDVLGMGNTKHRNGVLIFIAPTSQTFAIIGDEAIHARCGDIFWNLVRDEMVMHLKAGRYLAALLHGIKKAGILLAEHFPATAEDANEQPNAIVQD